ncbi:PEPxxWA-CTERM sorting domain-containing protein [Sphingomonas changnyeongensis]|uniref:PEPxxWA-CTERM sorting domain-containing protein n=1 Tax=Sphingomonas changnyeongensis TaxID=2698679 RepID=A0A7Z2NW33_9SPHN|nr:FxDxF family PEP-CTERM protein [Sphingomonas changnyeongensis]QHL90474.1 PEPxxWA-CTERM sorting domain-containing protein [Sphingomonas changnyeongensis]
MNARHIALAGFAAFLASPAPAAIYLVGTFGVPPTQAVNLVPSVIGSTGPFQDEFRFTVTAPLTIAASGFQTTALFAGSTELSNLDLGLVQLRSGFGNAGALIANFVNGGAVNALETSALAPIQLGAGQYTIVINGIVGTAPADYDGSIVFAAVPEPAVWASLITGFGLIGAAARRRRRSNGQIADPQLA